MVRLVPMTAGEFKMYIERAVQEYAQEHVKAGNWDPAEAEEKSRHDFQQLLPEGVASKNQHLFSIVDELTGGKVGMIWFAVIEKRESRLAFVYDFFIDPESRRRGYGTQALGALEETVKALGINRIALHVFGHNHAARTLYDKIGYTVTDINMAKELN
jgi:RimJ/RimL family protein N-acetyltransferase